MLRRFWVRPGREEEFERIFGLAGEWAELLRSSSGYRGSELKMESQVEPRFSVRDIWQSHLDFERFRSLAGEPLLTFAERLMRDGIVERVEVLGSFYEGEPGDDSLVPA